MIPNKIKTPEQYEQLYRLLKKYHVRHFLGIKHKNTILHPEDVKLVNITFPHECILYHEENNKWHTTVHKKSITINITALSIHYDSRSNTTHLGFLSTNDIPYRVHPKYKCIIEYIYNNKTYTSTGIIQKELVKH